MKILNFIPLLAVLGLSAHYIPYGVNIVILVQLIALWHLVNGDKTK